MPRRLGLSYKKDRARKERVNRAKARVCVDMSDLMVTVGFHVICGVLCKGEKQKLLLSSETLEGLQITGMYIMF